MKRIEGCGCALQLQGLMHTLVNHQSASLSGGPAVDSMVINFELNRVDRWNNDGS